MTANATATPRTVLITGASAGLGLALARLLAPDPRFRLVLTARPAALDRFAAAGLHAGERLLVAPLDVADQQSRVEAIRHIEATWGTIDVLVNNAGVSFRSVLEQANERERQLQMETNFLGAVHLIRLVLPAMRRQRRGHVINVSSVSGMMAMPTMAHYSASKWALEGASEALWYEVRPFGIHVTLVEPGFIRSESFRNTRLTIDSAAAMADDHAAYHAHYASMAPFIERLMQRAWGTPESIARKIRGAITSRRPPLRLLATPDARVFAAVRRWLPRRFYHWLLYRSLPGVGGWGRSR
ncbi:MAG: SDR family NAD(P)-dependent oxidoreductase [Planctomycetes bacterium]|nr:SDR family NAD(P)-dependent oxidoreductase [Planctomycetota bacterium]